MTSPSLLVIHNISLPPGEFGGPYIDQLFTGTLDPAQHPYFAEIHQLRVSAHCLIRRDGEIVQYVPFDQRAWHAGVSLYQGRDRCNDFSIGIELEGTDLLPYTEAQYRTLQAVTALLAEHYPPLVANIAGHCDIAPAARPIPGRRSIGIAIWHLWNNATRPPTLCLRQEKGEESLMTLFTLLLVLAWERLFKLGEHWQLDHRLEVVFQRLHRVSLAQTLAMTAAWMVIVWGVLWLSHGLFFGVVTLLLWIVIDLLCVGAGIKRKHYRAYLKAARQGDTHASDQMAEELALIHGLPVDCSEELRLRELQNALLWINFRYYLAPLFWFVVFGPYGPIALAGMPSCAPIKPGWRATIRRWSVRSRVSIIC